MAMERKTADKRGDTVMLIACHVDPSVRVWVTVVLPRTCCYDVFWGVGVADAGHFPTTMNSPPPRLQLVERLISTYQNDKLLRSKFSSPEQVSAFFYTFRFTAAQQT